MKVSVSLPDDDVAFLDEVAQELDLPSRSATLHRAVTALREARLEAAYGAAIEEWAAGEDAEAWDTGTGDGVR